MKRLLTRENEVNEYKLSISELKEGLISLAAMLNANNMGNLYIGINDKGESTNRLKLTDGIERDIKRAFKEHFNPYVIPNIKEVTIQSGVAIHVYVSGHDAPYSAYGISKFRVGASNEIMPKNKYKQLVEEEIAEEWEAKPSKYSIKDLNTKTFNSYLKSIIKNKRLNLDNQSPLIVLKKLGLLKGNKLLNAGAAIFVDNTKIKCQVAEFNGTDKTYISHVDEFEGNIIENINNINGYINRHTIGKTIMPNSINEHRTEVSELPQKALREALFNSFVHKNYVWDKTQNQVAIY
jgi:ATP-dependent DNA helicase RecG